MGGRQHGVPRLEDCRALASVHDGRCQQTNSPVSVLLVVPVAVTAGEKIKSLRQWASGRCLSADRAGVYSRSEGVSGGRGRRELREPGVN
ncbi:MAG: hypothetical protein DWH79_03700 [Planctomycetota bacterium]|nr:MAG: hypothetical protein DWH79_03700 [Planctomycetota bacterium]